MLSFTQYIINEAINAHSTHLEDLIFVKKEAGVTIALDSLRDIATNIGTGKAAGAVTVKIDGCFSPDTLVKTTEGLISFSQLINDFPNKIYNGPGKTKDGTGEIIIQKLQFPRVISGEKNWVSLETETGTIICTEDHLFMTKNGWVKAKDLEGEDLEELHD